MHYTLRVQVFNGLSKLKYLEDHEMLSSWHEKNAALT